MTNFLKTVFAFFESMGKARAAAMYTRMGNHDAAKKVMQE